MKTFIATIFTMAVFLITGTQGMADESAKDGIREVQAVLKECGFNPGPVDGAWGKRTTSAAQAYIQAHIGEIPQSNSVELLMALVVGLRTGDAGPCPKGGGKIQTGQADTNGNRIEKKYYDNGNLESETPYVNGEIYGIQKIYYKNGNLESEIPFVNGEKQD